MLIQLILFLLLGILAGIITGLIPGIHINLITILILSISASLLTDLNIQYLVVFITALAITHTFLDFIPSIFLGCPDTDTELSVLPGHQLLKQGQGYSAIILTAYGSLAAIILLLIIATPLLLLKNQINNTQEILKILTPGLLILASLFLISLERFKLKALLAFILTGLLGLCVLNFNTNYLSQPLLPLLTGLFGSSTILISLKNKTQIPKQEIENPGIFSIKPLLGAFFAAPLCSFLPGLGSGQAAIIGSTIIGKKAQDKRGFLLLLGATNTLVMGFSFISLYLISKTRTGAAVSIKELTHTLTTNIIILILITILLTGIISFLLTKIIAKTIATKISNINYTKISTITLSILCLIVLLVSKPLGLLILIISTLTGIYCINLKVRRTNMMGCLIIPTLVWYLF